MLHHAKLIVLGSFWNPPLQTREKIDKHLNISNLLHCGWLSNQTLAASAASTPWPLEQLKLLLVRGQRTIEVTLAEQHGAITGLNKYSLR